MDLDMCRRIVDNESPEIVASMLMEYRDVIDDTRDKLEALQAAYNEAVKVLEWYGDEANSDFVKQPIDEDGVVGYIPITRDGGQRARYFLTKHKAKN